MLELKDYAASFFQNSQDILCVANFEGYFLAVSPACRKILGYEPEELLEHPFLEFVHPQDKETTQKVVGSLMEKSDTLLNFQNRYRHKDDSYSWLMWNARSSSGDKRIYAVARDYSERRAILENLEQQRQEHEAILQTAAQGILTIDDRGTVHGFNLAAEQIFGYTAPEVLGKNVNMLMPEPYHGHHDIYLHNYLTSGVRKIIGRSRHVKGKRKNGQVFEMELAVSEIRTREARMFTGLIKDVSELVSYQNALVEEKEKALQGTRLKSQFLANMSHEIRTPMNAIIGYSECLIDGLDGPLNPEQDKSIRKVHRASQALLNLINNILDLSKIEAGKMVYAPLKFNLVKCISDSLETVATLAEKKGIRLKMDMPESVPVVADSRLLGQVFLNLLSNAIKFTDDGFVSVTAAVAAGKVKVDIQDTGIGMNKDETEVVFGLFTQADSSQTRKYQGTGLGLSISRKIAELHGGTITVRSNIGQGSTFTLEIPEKPQEGKEQSLERSDHSD